MDPLTLGIGAVGLGLKLFGGLGAMGAQSDIYKQQEDEAKQEQGINVQKQQAFVLQTQRAQMENFRNTQRARAMGINAGVNQGAQFGSGVAGGQGQAQTQGDTNQLGLTQNLGIGANIFSYNSKINADKLQIAQDSSEANTDTGIASLGGALMSGAGTMSNIGGAIGSGMGYVNVPGSGSGMFFNNSPWKFGSPGQ